MDPQCDPWVRRHGSPAFFPLRFPTRISPWAAEHTAERVSSRAFQISLNFCLNRSWAEMVAELSSGKIWAQVDQAAGTVAPALLKPAEAQRSSQLC